MQGPQQDQPVPLRPTEAGRERQMFLRLHDPTDPLDADAVFARYLPLARRIAGRYRSSGEPIEDLSQVASLGLLKAIRRFEVERGSRFSSFAVPVIRGELLRHLRDATWLVRVGRDQQHLALRVERSAWELTGQIGRSPTVEELSREVGCSLEEVVDARRALMAHRPASLNTPARRDPDGDTMVIDTLGGEDRGLEDVLERSQFETLLLNVPPRHREVVRLRFEHGMTQREIGARVGLSQMQVSRVLRDVRDRFLAVAQSA